MQPKDIAFRRSYSDAAKRCSDIINLHAVAGSWGKWAAIRLYDGGSDHVVYDTRPDAIRHQLDEFLCCYILIPPDGMQPKEAEEFLAWNRALYDNGFRMPDPEVIPPMRQEDVKAALRKLRR
jgi:hypothetical protein